MEQQKTVETSYRTKQFLFKNLFGFWIKTLFRKVKQTKNFTKKKKKKKIAKRENLNFKRGRHPRSRI